MDETSQIQPPPSFVEIYASRSGKLLIGKPELVARYELCEDLATHLVEQAQTLYHVQAPSEFEVLRRIHTGLCSAESGLASGEATWIVTRLAELLVWQCPELPTPSPAP